MRALTLVLGVAVLVASSFTSIAAPKKKKLISSSPVASSTLFCNFRGTIGAMYFVNDGVRPSFGCTAHCEWISGNTRFTGDFGKFDIAKGEKLERWTKDYGSKISRSEKARLTCDSP